MVLLVKPIKYFINDPNNHVLVPGALEVPPAPQGHYLCSLTMDLTNNYSNLIAETFGDPNLNAVFYDNNIENNVFDESEPNNDNTYTKNDKFINVDPNRKRSFLSDLIQYNGGMRTNKINNKYFVDNMIPEYRSTTSESSEEKDISNCKKLNEQCNQNIKVNSNNGINVLEDIVTSVQYKKYEEKKYYNKTSLNSDNSLKCINNRLELQNKEMSTEVAKKRLLHNELEKKRRLVSKDLFRQVMELLEPGVLKFPPKKIILSRAIEYIRNKNHTISSVVSECSGFHKERLKLIETLMNIYKNQNIKLSNANTGEKEDYNYI